MSRQGSGTSTQVSGFSTQVSDFRSKCDREKDDQDYDYDYKLQRGLTDILDLPITDGWGLVL